MKKIILPFLALFAFVSFFSSCSKEESSPSIVGKWTMSKTGVTVGNAIEWTDVTSDGCGQDYVLINADKTYGILFYYIDGSGCVSGNDEGTWNQEGGFFTANSNSNSNSDFKAKIHSLTNTVLIFANLDQDTFEPTGEYTQFIKFDDNIPAGTDKIVGTWKFAGEMTDGSFIPDESETCDDEILKMNVNFSGGLTVKDCGFSDEITALTWEKLGSTSYRIYNNTGLDKNITVEFSSNNQRMVISSATDVSPDVWDKQ